MNLIILNDHFAGKTTIVYKNHVMNGCQFWDMSDEAKTKSILQKYEVSDEQWQEVLDAIESGRRDECNPNLLVAFATDYCSKAEIDPVMRQLIVDAKNPILAFDYCNNVENDDDMRQVIIDAGNPEWAYMYCRWVSNDDDMRQIVLDSKDPKWACWYCQDVENDADMRQVILDSGSAEYAGQFLECVNSNDSDMKALARLC